MEVYRKDLNTKKFSGLPVVFGKDCDRETLGRKQERYSQHNTVELTKMYSN